MAKGIIVMNIPDKCYDCKMSYVNVYNQYECYFKPGSEFKPGDQKPDWCPIKPLSKEVEMQSFCCGTCKYHVPSEVPGDGDWVCDNAESEYYGIETGNADGCMDYEERE